MHIALLRWGFAAYVVVAIIFGLYTTIIWAIARKRQSWLRYLMLLLFLASLFDLPETFQRFSREAIFSALTLLGLMMHAAAYYFIFTGDAVPWFKRAKPVLSG